MQALRMSIRALRATPVVSLVVITTLGLGIGANTAIFTVANSLLLRALPVPAPDRLVTVSSDYALADGFKAGVGWNYQMWKRRQTMPPLACARARLVLGRSVAITGVGLILGLAAAATAARYLEALLFGVVPLDPLTFAVVAVVLAGVATTAALIPALRATRIDPLVALRSE